MKSKTNAMSAWLALAMTGVAATAALAQGIPGAVATPETAPAAEIPPAAVAEAAAKWQNLCSTCHGPNGKGDGPAGMALQPRPRDLTSAAWQSSVTDEHIEKVILSGGQSVSLSVLMPANPDLASKPNVLKALRAHVRSLAGK